MSTVPLAFTRIQHKKLHRPGFIQEMCVLKRPLCSAAASFTEASSHYMTSCTDTRVSSERVL